MDDERKWIEAIWQKIEEREKETRILRGLERKKESNLFVIAKEFLLGMGISGLLAGMADVMAVSMVIASCVFAGIYLALGFDPQVVTSMVFIFSPTLYTSIFCLSYMKEIQTNTFSVQMSCRYTFFHVLIFRMLLNSGLAVVFNLFYIFTLNSQFDLNLLKALALSFTSLMLFSVILLKILGGQNRILGFACVNLAWFGGNLIAFNGIKETYMRLLDQIPLNVAGLAILVCVVFYVRELKKMIRSDYRRRYLNA